MQPEDTARRRARRRPAARRRRHGPRDAAPRRGASAAAQPRRAHGHDPAAPAGRHPAPRARRGHRPRPRTPTASPPPQLRVDDKQVDTELTSGGCVEAELTLRRGRRRRPGDCHARGAGPRQRRASGARRSITVSVGTGAASPCRRRPPPRSATTVAPRHDRRPPRRRGALDDRPGPDHGATTRHHHGAHRRPTTPTDAAHRRRRPTDDAADHPTDRAAHDHDADADHDRPRPTTTEHDRPRRWRRPCSARAGAGSTRSPCVCVPARRATGRAGCRPTPPSPGRYLGSCLPAAQVLRDQARPSGGRPTCPERRGALVPRWPRRLPACTDVRWEVVAYDAGGPSPRHAGGRASPPPAADSGRVRGRAPARSRAATPAGPAPARAPASRPAGGRPWPRHGRPSRSPRSLPATT